MTAQEVIDEKIGRHCSDDEWLVSIADSLTRYELIYELEDALNVHIDEEDIRHLETVSELIAFVESL